MESLELLSAYAKWGTAILAFMAAGFGAWAIKTDRKSAKWTAAGLSLLAGMAGLLVIYADRGMEDRRREIRSTHPEVSAALKNSQTQEFYIEIESLDSIPFECHWVVVTRNDIIVSPFAVEWQRFYPTKETKLFRYAVDINQARVLDNYVGLRFRYRSGYSAEQNYPETLQGEVIRNYRLRNGTLEEIEP